MTVKKKSLLIKSSATKLQKQLSVAPEVISRDFLYSIINNNIKRKRELCMGKVPRFSKYLPYSASRIFAAVSASSSLEGEPGSQHTISGPSA